MFSLLLMLLKLLIAIVLFATLLAAIANRAHFSIYFYMVFFHVIVSVSMCRESFVAKVAFIRLLTGVYPHMNGKVPFFQELLIAPGMFATVPPRFVQMHVLDMQVQPLHPRVRVLAASPRTCQSL